MLPASGIGKKTNPQDVFGKGKGSKAKIFSDFASWRSQLRRPLGYLSVLLVLCLMKAGGMLYASLSG